MRYQLQITAAAEQDLLHVADYIDHILKNPQASDRLYDDLETEIGSLERMPQRYAVVDDPFLASHGIRALQVRNYMAFYRVSIENQTVTVLRILYAKSDWQTILKQSFPQS